MITGAQYRINEHRVHKVVTQKLRICAGLSSLDSSKMVGPVGLELTSRGTAFRSPKGFDLANRSPKSLCTESCEAFSTADV